MLRQLSLSVFFFCIAFSLFIAAMWMLAESHFFLGFIFSFWAAIFARFFYLAVRTLKNEFQRL